MIEGGGGRGDWAWYFTNFTMVCRIAHEVGGGGIFILEHHRVGGGGGASKI